MTSSVPTLDLGSSINCHDDWVNLSKTLSDSLSSQGYVYLINHGIPQQTISSAFKKTKEFFDLPYETKVKYLKPPEVVTYHGYNAKFAKDKISDSNILLREYFHAWDNLNNLSRLYPEEIEGMEDSILTLLYGRPTLNLNRILLKLLSRIVNNGNDDWILEPIHRGYAPNSTIRNYSYFNSMFYPRIPDGVDIGDDQRQAARCSAHTDCSTYTLLFLDQVGGLQRKDADGHWQDIPVLEGGILFITGDFLEAISGGKIPALVHRVPTESGRREERQSMPVYILPDNGAEFTPLNCTQSTTFGEYYEYLIRNRYFR